MRPRIRELDRDQCLAILSRNRVGRLAYARRNHIDIQPIHYVYEDGWIYGRTASGRKAQMLGPNWWPVAFEVDEVEGLFAWRSVVVHGGFYPLPVAATGADAEARHRAIEVLRRLLPTTLSPDDPVPERTIVFRIAVQDVSGREASSDLVRVA